jgi:thiol-disulfide isomerase/thioredoxin
VDRKKWLIPLVLIILAVMFVVSAVFSHNEEDMDADEVLRNISSRLQEQSVLITFSSESCISCQEQAVILDSLEDKYVDSVYFVHIDVNKYPRLASAFGVYTIPDTSIIAVEEGGQYMYMSYDGNISADRGGLRRFGLFDAEVLSHVLDMAVDHRNNTGRIRINPDG